MKSAQPEILAEVPRLARYLTFSLLPDVKAHEAIKAITNSISVENNVIGIGKSLILASRSHINRLVDFPQLAGPGIDIPSTPAALWCWLKGDDRGELVHRTRTIESELSDFFELSSVIDAFQYADSRDMTGYVDGTENPTGEAAETTAIVLDQGEGLNGSSFVAVQLWVHDLDYFEELSQKDKDAIIGRRLSDNEEMDEAPPTAHVKRTAQESFEPEAFIVRRSMPWADDESTGLVFVAFGNSFDAFEALLTRMVGADDGVVDAIFRISRPISGAYFWCPPVKNGKLDLSMIIG